MAGANDCRIIGPSWPVVVIDMLPLRLHVNVEMTIGGRKTFYVRSQSYLVKVARPSNAISLTQEQRNFNYAKNNLVVNMLKRICQRIIGIFFALSC